MKKFTKVLLTLIIVVIILSAGVVLWQYDNITALLNGLTKSTEEIASDIDKKRDDLKVKVEKYTNSTINDISAEDEQKLIKGEINLDDIAKKYDLPIGYMQDDGKNESINDSKSEDKTIDSNLPVDNAKKIEKEIGDSVSRMYAIKAKYVNKLGELEREVIDQYSKLPESKQNENGKKELVMANVDYVAQLEKTCDTDVSNVISTLEKNLKESGGDLEIIQILKDAYKEEKELKKSYYLSLYNE